MISIKKYNHKLQYVWDDFITKSISGTIFHFQKFLTYHIDKNFQDHSLMIYKKKILVAVVPAALIVNNGLVSFYSHPGASFGGIIFHKLAFNEIDLVLGAIEKYCLNKNIDSIQIIPSPACYQSIENNVLNYALCNKGYLEVEQYLSHVVSLKNLDSPLKYLNKRKRRYINNLYINNDQYAFVQTTKIEEYYEILFENKKRFGLKPTHSLHELKKLIQLFPKQILLFGTFYKNVLIGGAIIFKTTNESVLLFYNAISNHSRNVQLGLFQVYKIIEYCKNCNFSVLDLGVSHLPKGKNPLAPKKSLIKFKEQCGGLGVIRSVFMKKLNREI